MSPSVFLDRGSLPGPGDVEAALGDARARWAELESGLRSMFAPLTEHWSYSGKSLGWLLQLKRGKTTVVNLVPGRGDFVASLALTARACEAAEASDLSPATKAVVRESPKYSEGRGVRIAVRTRRDVADVLKLAAIRMANVK